MSDASCTSCNESTNIFILFFMKLKSIYESVYLDMLRVLKATQDDVCLSPEPEIT